MMTETNHGSECACIACGGQTVNMLEKENAAICPRCGRQGCATYANGTRYCSLACARGLMQPERSRDYADRIQIIHVTEAKPMENNSDHHLDDCESNKSGEWSGSPDPANPDNDWICDECGAVIRASLIPVKKTV